MASKTSSLLPLESSVPRQDGIPRTDYYRVPAARPKRSDSPILRASDEDESMAARRRWGDEYEDHKVTRILRARASLFKEESRGGVHGLQSLCRLVILESCRYSPQAVSTLALREQLISYVQCETDVLGCFLPNQTAPTAAAVVRWSG